MNRYDVINHFVTTRGYKSFLEIGTLNGETFRAVKCPHKVSVDPVPRTNPTYCMTSDEFFKTNKETFDIVFIDGLHECNQVWRDITNSLKSLNHGGVIVMHDCHPTSERMQEHHTESQYGYDWTGDVWKAFVKARAELPYELYVLDHDMGCGIIDTTKPKTTDTSSYPTDMDHLNYGHFLAHPDWFNFRSTFIPERIAVYCATRNLYHQMVTVSKSLIANNGADRVIFITEDDEFPEKLPPCISTLNLSGQTFFSPSGPNYKSAWTWMVMIRVAFTKLFPYLDRVLSIDCDMIVNHPLDEIWNTQFGNAYFALVREPDWFWKTAPFEYHKVPYFNFGLSFQNLDKLRKDKMDDWIIYALNNRKTRFPEQDIVNQLCNGQIKELPEHLNTMLQFHKDINPTEPTILHYAAMQWKMLTSDEYKKYEKMSWDDALKRRDIIQNGGENNG